MTAVTPLTPVTHPLAMVTADEIRAASAAVKADARFPAGALLACTSRPRTSSALGARATRSRDRWRCSWSPSVACT